MYKVVYTNDKVEGKLLVNQEQKKCVEHNQSKEGG
jgi:hypothetical protein